MTPFKGQTEHAGHFLQPTTNAIGQKVIALLLLSLFEHQAGCDVAHQGHFERVGAEMQTNSDHCTNTRQAVSDVHAVLKAKGAKKMGQQIMKQKISLGGLLLLLSFSGTLGYAQGRGRPAPPPSRYGYTLKFDAKSLPKGVKIRTVRSGKTTRHFIKNTSDAPLVINERYQAKRLVSGTKLVSGKVYHYFPNGVPMAGKRHLKGWQAPFGVIKETLLVLPNPPATIYKGRKPGLSKKLPPVPTENSIRACIAGHSPFEIPDNPV